MSEKLECIFNYLLDFTKYAEEYNDDMNALLSVEEVITLLNYINISKTQLQQKENIIKEVREEMENAKHISIDDSKAIIEHERKILKILDETKGD